VLRRPRAAFAQVRPRRGRLGANSDSPLADEFVATDPRVDAPPRFEDLAVMTIARRQLLAVDLRELIGAIRVASDF